MALAALREPERFTMYYVRLIFFIVVIAPAAIAGGLLVLAFLGAMLLLFLQGVFEMWHWLWCVVTRRKYHAYFDM